MPENAPPKLTGGKVNYYLAKVGNPQRDEQPPYQAECEDIIQALGMDFNEGCLFKELWRTAAARQGNGKPGHTPLYGAEKLVHYAQRILRQQRSQESLPGDWIKWEGGVSPPVPEEQCVHVRLRHYTEVISELPQPARIYRWTHTQSYGDIVAYRLA